METAFVFRNFLRASGVTTRNQLIDAVREFKDHVDVLAYKDERTIIVFADKSACYMIHNKEVVGITLLHETEFVSLLIDVFCIGRDENDEPIMEDSINIAKKKKMDIRDYLGERIIDFMIKHEDERLIIDRRVREGHG